jgi:hypothetical protein
LSTASAYAYGKIDKQIGSGAVIFITILFNIGYYSAILFHLESTINIYCPGANVLLSLFVITRDGAKFP